MNARLGLFSLVVVCSLAFSVVAVWLNHVINNDGIIYLQQADAFGRLQWREGLEIFRWPAYALSIAGFSALTGIEELAAAHTLNALFTAGICYLFVRLVADFGGGTRTLLFAAFVILFYYGINRYRAFIIRDPAYLFFFFAGIHQFLLHLDNGRARHLLLSLGMLVLASTFRIEGMIFFVVLPLFLIYNQLERRRHKALLALVIVAAAGLVYGIYLWWQYEHLLDSSPDLSTKLEVVAAAARDLYFQRAESLNRILFAGEQPAASYLVVILTVFTIVAGSVIARLDVLLAILVYLAIRRQYFRPPRPVHKFWRLLVVVQVAILLNFVADQFFLAPRYAVALTISLLLPVPFLLEAWYRDLVEHRRPWSIPGLRLLVWMLLIAVIGANGLLKGTNKDHLKDAARWVREQADPGDTLFTNNRIMAYYADRTKLRVRVIEDWDWVAPLLEKGALRKHDFTLLDIGDNAYGRRWMTKIAGRPPDFSARNRDNRYVYGYRRSGG